MRILLLSLVITASLFNITGLASSEDHLTGIPVVINELMASNSTTARDPHGQYDDWIEIHNFGDTPLNIAGMYLTDDVTEPTKWQIPTDSPSDTIIPAHGYLLIWADNDTADAGLHANFKLDATGEELALFDASTAGIGDVTLIDHVVFDEQIDDISSGRYPDAGDNFNFLVAPTPGAENAVAYAGAVSEPQFSHPRGFHSEPFSVVLTTQTQGATIYYTLDGSQPHAAGVPYTDPILIDKTTCLRARAIKEGWMPSKTIASSYFFLDDVIHQPAHPQGLPTRWGSRTADYEMDPDIVDDPRYRDNISSALTSIPTMSVVMNSDDMFGDSGVYANPGADREMPASVELIYPDAAQEGFQVNCGIKIIGGASRNMSLKNSFRLLFKGIYGPSKLRFPLFGPDAADQFNTIVLRSSFNDGYGWSGARFYEQYTRDNFIRALQKDMGHISPNNMAVHLYINGLYWGLYFPCERPDASFSASYYGGEEEDWDTFSHSGITLREGNDDALQQMRALSQQVSHSYAAYQQLQGNNPDGSPNPDYPCLLDVTNYVDYLILNYAVNNEDWPWNNYWFARKRTADSTGFKFYSWDSEISLYMPPRAHMQLNRTADYRNVGQFHGYLAQNNEYRLFFADRVHHHLFNNGVLTPEYTSQLYLDVADQVEMPVICESARWGDMHHSQPLNQDDWYDMRDWLLENFFYQRHDIVLQQLRNAGLYPNVAAPTFHVNNAYQHGGHADRLAGLAMQSPSGTIYYTLDGSDPRQTEAPLEPGTAANLVTDATARKVLIPTGPISDAWRGDLAFDDAAWISGTGAIGYERGSGYEALIDIDVTAQMVNGNTSCYIRIPFTITEDPADFDLLMLNMRYDDAFIAYINGVEVQRVFFTGTPAWNSQAQSNHEAESIEYFDLSAHLSALRPGQNILAIHGLNVSANSSDFIIAPELTARQGGTPGDSGISPAAMEYTEPITLTASGQVKSRALDGDTWSALNEATFAVGPVAENLRITEIMYHPQETGDADDPNEEFIELRNIGAETLNLNLVKFTNGIDFTFPDLDLAPGRYVVVVADQQAFAARYGADINIAGQYAGRLANDGERIRLEDAVGQTILDFKYNDNWYSLTDGKGHSLTIVDEINTHPDNWNQKDAWRPSANPAGSPG